MEWEYEDDNDGFDDPNFVIGGTARHCERLYSKYDEDSNETPTNDASLEDIATYSGEIVLHHDAIHRKHSCQPKITSLSQYFHANRLRPQPGTTRL